MGRHPHPILLGGRPVTGPPGVAVLIPDPTPRRPEVVSRRRGNVGTDFGGGGRLWQVADFAHLGIGPVPGSPLKDFAGRAPITGNPLAPRRQRPPDAAYPQKILP